MATSIRDGEKGWLEAARVIDNDNLDRVFSMMRAWWEGRTLRDIAREHGISRQRVGKILASVSCTRQVLRKARHDMPTSTRRGRPDLMAAARQMLLHPLAGRLTVRQRGALAWQAQGLVLVDVARRMATTVHGIYGMTYGAKLRLERLEYMAQMKRYEEDMPTLDRSDLEAMLAATSDPADGATLQ